MNRIRRRQFGMTLIELVVVMGLLAALATYALTSLDGLSDRSRVDTTINRLDMLQQAIVGDGLTASRFMNDMGRLPYLNGGSEGQEFKELWDKIRGTTMASAYTYSFSINGHTSSIDVEPNYGWKGPYIASTNEELYDGFGNSFKVKTTNDSSWCDSTNGTDASEITDICSFGRDNDGDGLDWADKDIDITNIEIPATRLVIKVRTTYRGTPVTEPVWGKPEVSATTVSDPLTADSYTVGQIYLDTTGKLFRCKHVNSAVPTGASLPNAWDTATNIGDEINVTDGGTTVYTTWEYLGNSSQYMSEVKAVVFCPDTTGTNATVDPISESLSTGDTITFSSDSGLTPGVRWFFVYGGLVASGGSTSANCYRSSLQSIELKPGDNFVTVYLTKSWH